MIQISINLDKKKLNLNKWDINKKKSKLQQNNK